MRLSLIMKNYCKLIFWAEITNENVQCMSYSFEQINEYKNSQPIADVSLKDLLSGIYTYTKYCFVRTIHIELQ